MSRSGFAAGNIPSAGSEFTRDAMSGKAMREVIRISWSVTEIAIVLGKRKDFRSLALGSFSASMLKTSAESPDDPVALEPA